MNKNIKILLATLLVFTSPVLLGQQSRDVDRKLADLRAEVSSLELQLSAQQHLVAELAQKAKASVAANMQIAENLKNNVADKKTAKSARKSARKALRDGNQATEANSRVIAIQDQIRQKKEQISSLESHTAILTAPAEAFERAPVALRADTTRATASHSGTSAIAEKVVEATYKAYQQQPGQPSIIINNIITPPAYPENSGSPVAKRERPTDSWRTSPRANPEGNQSGDDISNLATAPDQPQKRASRSGIWIVPVAGLHASNFHADFEDSKAEGRTGWNAGLDFRIHFRRFFIQPGVHYMNSSLDLTSKDSLEHAPVFAGPRIQSLKVPVMFGIYLTKAQHGFFKINVKAGASGNYLLAVQRDAYKQFDRKNLETYSYGLVAGIGMEFGLITLDVAHEWGISGMFKDKDTKNNILRLTLGLKL